MAAILRALPRGKVPPLARPVWQDREEVIVDVQVNMSESVAIAFSMLPLLLTLPYVIFYIILKRGR